MTNVTSYTAEGDITDNPSKNTDKAYYDLPVRMLGSSAKYFVSLSAMLVVLISTSWVSIYFITVAVCNAILR